MQKIREKYRNFEALQLFLEICKIPHASFSTQNLREWVINRAREFGASVQCDEAGNVQCSKGSPQLCLQGHLDMVYVGKEESSIEPRFFEREGVEYLKAHSTSLGADNGVALACMLLALRDCQNIECLFTNDEEVGMIGANHIALNLKSTSMLNCDSEEIDELVYSCAGGYDLEAQAHFERLEIPRDCAFFHISTKGFCGGHSGIEIHKNIPNAILELARLAESLRQSGALIVEFCGGEKRNSIPVYAHLTIAIPKDKLESAQALLNDFTQETFIVESAPAQTHYFQAQTLLKALLSLPNGVLRTQDSMPTLSSNLGILKQDSNKERITMRMWIMGRGNMKQDMQTQLKAQKAQLQDLGFQVEVCDCYDPWEREDSKLLQILWEIYQIHSKNPQLKSIHAGLECGILKQKYPHISFASIGPTIHHPHSVNEELDLESFVRFNAILQETLKRFQAF